MTLNQDLHSVIDVKEEQGEILFTLCECLRIKKCLLIKLAKMSVTINNSNIFIGYLTFKCDEIFFYIHPRVKSLLLVLSGQWLSFMNSRRSHYEISVRFRHSTAEFGPELSVETNFNFFEASLNFLSNRSDPKSSKIKLPIVHQWYTD